MEIHPSSYEYHKTCVLFTRCNQGDFNKPTSSRCHEHRRSRPSSDGCGTWNAHGLVRLVISECKFHIQFLLFSLCSLLSESPDNASSRNKIGAGEEFRGAIFTSLGKIPQMSLSTKDVPSSTSTASRHQTPRTTRAHTSPILTWSVTVEKITNLWFFVVLSCGLLGVSSVSNHFGVITSSWTSFCTAPESRTGWSGVFFFALVRLLRPLRSYVHETLKHSNCRRRRKFLNIVLYWVLFDVFLFLE